jgi:hypothetical protein
MRIAISVFMATALGATGASASLIAGAKLIKLKD